MTNYESPSSRRTIAIILAAGSVSPELLADLGPIRTSSIPLGGVSISARHLNELYTECDELLLVADIRDVDELRVQIGHSRFPKTKIVEARSEWTFLESLRKALCQTNLQQGRVLILFGDTLSPVPRAEDAISVAPAPDSDRWAMVSRDEAGSLNISVGADGIPGALAVVGMFSFSDAALLRGLLESGERISRTDDFWSVIEAYDGQKTLALEEVDSWLDVGHIDTFYAARRATLSGRAFNDFQTTTRTIRKQSSRRSKIADEVRWFDLAPVEAEPLLPRIRAWDTSRDPAWYEMDFVPAISLGEAWTFAALDSGFWDPVSFSIERAHRLMTDLSVEPSSSGTKKGIARDLLVTKVKERIRVLSTQLLRNDPPLSENIDSSSLIQELTAVVNGLEALAQSVAKETPFGFCHGDFFLGNMLYDRRVDSLTLLDPRGRIGAEVNFGPFIYDVAKLSHSIRSSYDFLAANLFHLNASIAHVELDIVTSSAAENARVSLLRAQMAIEERLGLSRELVRRVEATLLISAAALHYEQPLRQLALLLSGLRVWSAVADE